MFLDAQALLALICSLRHNVLEIVQILHHDFLLRQRWLGVVAATVHFKLFLGVVGLVRGAAIDFAALLVAPRVLTSTEGLRDIVVLDVFVRMARRLVVLL